MPHAPCQSSSEASFAGTLPLGDYAVPRVASLLHELIWCAEEMLGLAHAAGNQAAAVLLLLDAWWDPASMLARMGMY